MKTKSKVLRIALVTAFPPGQQSLNEYGLHLAKGFAERKDVAEVIVIADKLPTREAELDLGPKVQVQRVWSFNSPLSAAVITARLCQERPDAVLFNVQTATFGDWEVPAALGSCAPVLARIAGIPSGVLAHNLICGIDLDATQLRGQRLRQLLVRFGGALTNRLLLTADYLSVTLESYRDMLAKNYPNANVALIPHGTFDTTFRNFKQVEDRPMRIVTMGKFGTYKRLENLLKAFKIILESGEFPDLELVIGGQDHPSVPGYMNQLSEQVADNEKIRFVGYLPEEDIPDFFGAARVSVFDYDATTGSSGVLHQTASYGAVPVFPCIGDFVDVCRDEGLTGVNYQAGHAEDMANAISSVLRDNVLANEIARTNRSAAMGMPFSQVIARHMDFFLAAKKTRAKPQSLGKTALMR